uniref:MAK10-like protein n=1 Tax=Tanacetum cinerariifolium TaxID=118510 RepID=A0A6L2MVH9_TANCI|nr:MAK10-like protein [Tanacetum cinerariifolium]
MGDVNPICIIRDYSKPSHDGYMNIIELPIGNNVVPLDPTPSGWCKLDAHSMDFGKERTCVYFNVSFAIKLATGLNVFQQDPSPHGRILLLVSLLNSFHREGLQNSATTSLCSNNINESLSQKDELVSRTYTKNGKLYDKNADESWEIIENLALYDQKGWNDSKEFVKPVKAISTPQNTSKTPDRRLLELEDQINFLLKGSRSTPRPSSMHTPQAYAKAPQALGTTFEARVWDYMEAHTERMERFKNSIFKQQEEINDRTAEIGEEERNDNDDMAADGGINGTDTEMPVKEAEKETKVENGTKTNQSKELK